MPDLSLPLLAATIHSLAFNRQLSIEPGYISGALNILVSRSRIF